MGLSLLFQYELKAVLADGYWQRKRWQTAWCSVLAFVLMVLPSFWIDVRDLHRYGLSFFFWMPALLLSPRLINALLEIIPYMRRNEMFDLILLTGTTPLMIWFSRAMALLVVWGISVAAAWPAALLVGVFAKVPFYYLILKVGVTLLLMFYLFVLVLLASSITKEDGLAYSGLIFWGGISSFVFPALVACLIQSGAGSFLGSRWMLLSPFWGYYQAMKQTLIHQDIFLVFSGIILWTGLLLGVACWLIQRRTIDVVQPGKAIFLEVFRILTGWSLPQSGNLLARLIQREWRVALSLWMLVIVFTGGFSYLLWDRGLMWFSPVDFLLSAVLLLVLAWFYLSSTAERITAEARRTGLLELLLTAGIKPDEFIRDLHQGVIALYARLVMFLIIYFMVLGFLGAQIREFNWMAASTYFVAWLWCFFALHRLWFGSKARSIWMALNLGRPSYSVAKLWMPILGAVMGFVVRIFFMDNGMFNYQTLAQFPFGNGVEFILVILGSVIMLPLTSINADDFSEDTLLQNFREVASDPVPDPADQRIEQWDVSKPFPAQKEK